MVTFSGVMLVCGRPHPPSRSEESGGALCSGASGGQTRDGRKGPMFLEVELEANETLMARLSQ